MKHGSHGRKVAKMVSHFHHGHAKNAHLPHHPEGGHPVMPSHKGGNAGTAYGMTAPGGHRSKRGY